MEIEYDKRGPRVKILDYPIGTVFKFEDEIYMKICLTNQSYDYEFVSLETGQRPPLSVHNDINYGTIEILDAKLVVSKR